MLRGMLKFTLFAASAIAPMHANAYVGTYYADFGQDSKEVACQRILEVFKAFLPLSSYPGKCLYVDKNKFFSVIGPVEDIVLQFKKINGTVYEMVYDLPNRNGGYGSDEFSRYMAFGGAERLEAAGVTLDQSKLNVAAAKRKQEEEYQAAYQKIAPPCREITFSGIAVANPLYFPQYAEARDKKDVLARNPIICTESVSGQPIFGGAGLYNPTYRRECRGLAAFSNHKASIQSWDTKFYQIATDIETGAGLRTVPLYIRREDARCGGK